MPLANVLKIINMLRYCVIIHLHIRNTMHDISQYFQIETDFPHSKSFPYEICVNNKCFHSTLILLHAYSIVVGNFGG